ncbi:hypothetical protein BAE44_0007982 [Dichanthelium oligosanthes]|uniref:Uncharacterized protein n=1 Tax=Dichanthelium oligosanthes TaxID=888268 RepID=A0A1E5W0Y0_9POAL|nr:hypothetical protein BAE44_0007982 [Dichanthelium oligosanthes]
MDEGSHGRWLGASPLGARDTEENKSSLACSDCSSRNWPATRTSKLWRQVIIFSLQLNLASRSPPTLADLGLADAIKVSTPVAFSAVDVSWPPSAGRFQNDIAEPVMKPMLDLLERTGSYLTVNLYPFFAYAANPDKISRDYFRGTPTPASVTP